MQEIFSLPSLLGTGDAGNILPFRVYSELGMLGLLSHPQGGVERPGREKKDRRG